jgi:hypothetical protein
MSTHGSHDKDTSTAILFSNEREKLHLMMLPNA